MKNCVSVCNVYIYIYKEKYVHLSNEFVLNFGLVIRNVILAELRADNFAVGAFQLVVRVAWSDSPAMDIFTKFELIVTMMTMLKLIIMIKKLVIEVVQRK